MRDVFGWEPQPFAAPDYLVAPHGDGPGVDAGRIESAGGTIVVEPFTLAGVGRGCYLTDPASLLIGLHEHDSSA